MNIKHHAISLYQKAEIAATYVAGVGAALYFGKEMGDNLPALSSLAPAAKLVAYSGIGVLATGLAHGIAKVVGKPLGLGPYASTELGRSYRPTRTFWGMRGPIEKGEGRPYRSLIPYLFQPIRGGSPSRAYGGSHASSSETTLPADLISIVIDPQKKFRTKKQLTGQFELGADIIIPNKAAASKFYWEARGDTSVANREINALVESAIGKVDAEQALDLDAICQMAKDKINNGYETIGRGWLGREKKVRVKGIEQRYGFRITNLSPYNLQWDAESKTIVQMAEKSAREAQASLTQAAAAKEINQRFLLAACDASASQYDAVPGPAGPQIVLRNEADRPLVIDQLTRIREAMRHEEIAEKGGLVIGGGSGSPSPIESYALKALRDQEEKTGNLETAVSEVKELLTQLITDVQNQENP